MTGAQHMTSMSKSNLLNVAHKSRVGWLVPPFHLDSHALLMPSTKAWNSLSPFCFPTHSPSKAFAVSSLCPENLLPHSWPQGSLSLDSLTHEDVSHCFSLVKFTQSPASFYLFCVRYDYLILKKKNKIGSSPGHKLTALLPRPPDLKLSNSLLLGKRFQMGRNLFCVAHAGFSAPGTLQMLHISQRTVMMVAALWEVVSFAGFRMIFFSSLPQPQSFPLARVMQELEK